MRAASLARNYIGQSKLAIRNDPVFQWRERFTVAQINAGATFLPAVPGYKYRVVDAAMIAIGGAVTAATTVDLLATRAAAAVKLMASAVANLTENALLRAGGTGGAILAAGASFTETDVNTAITVGKTGASAATATHVDVLVSYCLVRSNTGAV